MSKTHWKPGVGKVWLTRRQARMDHLRRTMRQIGVRSIWPIHIWPEIAHDTDYNYARHKIPQMGYRRLRSMFWRVAAPTTRD